MIRERVGCWGGRVTFGHVEVPMDRQASRTPQLCNAAEPRASRGRSPTRGHRRRSGLRHSCSRAGGSNWIAATTRGAAPAGRLPVPPIRTWMPHQLLAEAGNDEKQFRLATPRLSVPTPSRLPVAGHRRCRSLSGGPEDLREPSFVPPFLGDSGREVATDAPFPLPVEPVRFRSAAPSVPLPPCPLT